MRFCVVVLSSLLIVGSAAASSNPIFCCRLETRKSLLCSAKQSLCSLERYVDVMSESCVDFAPGELEAGFTSHAVGMFLDLFLVLDTYGLFGPGVGDIKVVEKGLPLIRRLLGDCREDCHCSKPKPCCRRPCAECEEQRCCPKQPPRCGRACAECEEDRCYKKQPPAYERPYVESEDDRCCKKQPCCKPISVLPDLNTSCSSPGCKPQCAKGILRRIGSNIALIEEISCQETPTGTARRKAFTKILDLIISSAQSFFLITPFLEPCVIDGTKAISSRPFHPEHLLQKMTEALGSNGRFLAAVQQAYEAAKEERPNLFNYFDDEIIPEEQVVAVVVPEKRED